MSSLHVFNHRSGYIQQKRLYLNNLFHRVSLIVSQQDYSEQIPMKRGWRMSLSVWIQTKRTGSRNSSLLSVTLRGHVFCLFSFYIFVDLSSISF